MRHHAPGFEQFSSSNTTTKEKAAFLKISIAIPKNDLPLNASIITTHTIHTVKKTDYGKFEAKARLALHENDDDFYSLFRKKRLMCSPIGLRIMQLIAPSFRRNIYIEDVLSVFYKQGKRMKRNMCSHRLNQI